MIVTAQATPGFARQALGIRVGRAPRRSLFTDGGVDNEPASGLSNRGYVMN